MYDRAVAVQLETRDRLVATALRLFAKKGYQATTVAEIEGEAGLSPGAGGMYRHFASKQALLDAALAAATSEVDGLEGVQRLLPLGDLRSELTLIARAGLAGIQQSRTVLGVIERDGDLVPEIRRRAAGDVIGRGHRAAADLMTALFESHDLLAPDDALPLAVLAVGGLSNFARELELYGETSGVDEERLLQAWVDVWYAFAMSLRPGGTDRPAR